MARISKTQRLRQYKGLIKFIEEHPEAGRVFLDKKRVPYARLGAILREYVEAAARTEAALRAYRAAVRAEAPLLARAREIAPRVTSGAKLLLGFSSPMLETYGIKPERKVKKSVEVLALQVEKARATRRARGTMKR